MFSHRKVKFTYSLLLKPKSWSTKVAGVNSLLWFLLKLITYLSWITAVIYTYSITMVCGARNWYICCQRRKYLESYSVSKPISTCTYLNSVMKQPTNNYCLPAIQGNYLLHFCRYIALLVIVMASLVTSWESIGIILAEIPTRWGNRDWSGHLL